MCLFSWRAPEFAFYGSAPLDMADETPYFFDLSHLGVLICHPGSYDAPFYLLELWVFTSKICEGPTLMVHGNIGPLSFSRLSCLGKLVPFLPFAGSNLASAGFAFGSGSFACLGGPDRSECVFCAWDFMVSYFFTYHLRQKLVFWGGRCPISFPFAGLIGKKSFGHTGYKTRNLGWHSDILGTFLHFAHLFRGDRGEDEVLHKTARRGKTHASSITPRNY
ncbi:hypothetical protein B0T21DRAFT_6567 [Apiosordaria backusii]|uniref:Uncharacterized protein n=1 Tax=Apiosordaria backusii TaxID=314023 RepID=A0AA40K693_9PEZI|nr:hypothetical protein B0T21DRAFT_6567 [Apiosordaria backusii]